ncbi:DUF4011 domain-containing protein [Acidisoma sp. S159]|uniref:DUF4011 domain-containing protein n=1 Tax=Acidisoma sp. S159 TaxID=1747225 RepID=UPI00131CC402|nr:DUF4011 domain-containing protein [Acidisoma sp. S159]
MDDATHYEARWEASAASIRTLRNRLLDLTARNPLISFPHSRQTGSRTSIRAVNSTIDALFHQLDGDRALIVRSLPPMGTEPDDERTDLFRSALEVARITDEQYQSALSALAEDELASAKAASIERGLRNRVRDDLKFPLWRAANAQGLADYATSLGLSSSFDLKDTSGKSRKTDNVDLQTLMLPEPMERALAKIRDTARTVAEETGISTLHVAFGFLEWFESDSSDRPLASPLLLMRVDIDRKIVRSRYQYFLNGVGDDAQINFTLSERMNRDFRIKLPELVEEESPEAYLSRIDEEICKGRPRWSVRRWVTLAHFPFARLAMFQDLDEEHWANAGGLSHHPLLAELLGGSGSGASSFAEEHDVDSPQVAAKVPILVLEADASQHSAIYDVMSGKSLVIEGPPGTGKSQTIANMIGAALASGRRVLFMADKQAALQVVKDRLDKVGLGDFCLELHSGKAKKKEVLDGIKQRLERRPATAAMDDLDRKLRDLSTTRKSLSDYANLLNAPLGVSGATVHDVLWADRRRRDPKGDEDRYLDEIFIRDCEKLHRSDIEKRKASLDRFEDAANSIRSGSPRHFDHPWMGVTRSNLPSVDLDQAVRDTADAAALFNKLAIVAENIRLTGIEVEPTVTGLQRLSSALSSLHVQKDLSADFYRGLNSASTRRDAETWIANCENFRISLFELHHRGFSSVELDSEKAANDISRGWERAAAFVPPGMVVSGLDNWMTELHFAAKSILELVKTAAQAADLFELSPRASIDEIQIILQGIEVAGEADTRIFELCSVELMSSENRHIIERAFSDISILKQQRDTLSELYNFVGTENAGELRRHAENLRDAGMLGFLSNSVKAAKRAYLELRKTPGRAATSEMVTAFNSVAEHLRAADALSGRQDYRAILGINFQGLDTDIRTINAVGAWAARVRSRLIGVSDLLVEIRRVLLSGDRDRLRAIAAAGHTSEVAVLKKYLGEATDKAMSLESVAAGIFERYSAAQHLANACARHGVPGNERIEDLPRLCQMLAAANAAKQLARPAAPLAALLGPGLQPSLGDHVLLRNTIAFAVTVSSLPVGEEVKRALHGLDPAYIERTVVPAAREAKAAVDEALSAWGRIRTRLLLEEGSFLGGTLLSRQPSTVAARLRLASDHQGELGEWIAYLIERENLDGMGLGELLALWDQNKTKQALSEVFDRVLHRDLARLAFAVHPGLDRFSGLAQEETRARFSSLDADAAELRRSALAGDLSRRPIPIGNGIGKRAEYTGEALLRLEISKLKRHIPIRQLLDRAGDSIQALKPCFMMSPLSVSQYLKPGALRFDLLVIDEASQMRPEDALGAIARSNQIVVVGDPKQLPPTPFFARNDDEVDDPGDEEEQVDAESILDLAQTVFRPMRRLRWHYRSRHGSLIAFSNREFYDDDLIVFPSPAEADPSQGVALVKVAGIYKSRSNLPEVEAICDAAVAHMQLRPDRSLGIATMNQVQRELIEQRMDQITSGKPEVQEYRERWEKTLERFFIKNLENVQGDERDVIFVSTVFGPSQPGGVVKRTFGPINGASGHRRLNVLFTRAKHHLRLFTSMTPDDVLIGMDGPRGAQVLKRYLAYAQDGRLDAGVETGREADSDFELFVRDRLRLAGYDVVPQVGVAGYFIDLAVRHPELPGTFLAGIECDGASYHSSRSARDRDILRQKVLEGLGWTIYRIWSPDWFRDPAGQTLKLVAFINELRKRQLRTS